MEGAIKKNADAELAFNTAHSLILKLAQHKAKASPDPPQVRLFKIDIHHIKSEVAIASPFRQIQQPNIFLLEVKTITKLPGNGIAESVKSCNLHQKGRILWF